MELASKMMNFASKMMNFNYILMNLRTPRQPHQLLPSDHCSARNLWFYTEEIIISQQTIHHFSSKTIVF